MTDRRPSPARRWQCRRFSVCGRLTRVARCVRTLPDRPARLDKAFKRDHDQEPRVEVQVTDMHLLGVTSLVLGDVSDPTYDPPRIRASGALGVR